MVWIKSKIIAISTGNHYAFKRYAEAFDIPNVQVPHAGKKANQISRFFNLFRALRSIPKGYDYYLCESCYYYVALARRLGLIKGKIINVCCSPLYYNLLHKRAGWLQGRVLSWLLKDVDASVCQGEYVCDILKELGVEKPAMVTYTFVNPDRYKELSELTPALESKTVTMIATHDWYYKGIDIALEAMKIINEKRPEIRLHLVIRNIDMSRFKGLLGPNVKVSEDAMAALKESALYIHPARGDIFPVAPQEAMVAGIPVIASGECGTKEFLDKEMVCGLDSKDLAERILGYFKLDNAGKKELSRKAREAVKRLEEKKVLLEFESDFGQLIKKL